MAFDITANLDALFREVEESAEKRLTALADLQRATEAAAFAKAEHLKAILRWALAHHVNGHDLDGETRISALRQVPLTAFFGFANELEDGYEPTLLGGDTLRVTTRPHTESHRAERDAALLALVGGFPVEYVFNGRRVTMTPNEAQFLANRALKAL